MACSNHYSRERLTNFPGGYSVAAWTVRSAPSGKYCCGGLSTAWGRDEPVFPWISPVGATEPRRHRACMLPTDAARLAFRH